MVWVSSPWSHLCSDMGIPNGKNNNTANGVNYFPLLNVVIILTLGPLTSFPRNPIWAKTLRYSSKETFYSTFTQSDSLQMEVLE